MRRENSIKLWRRECTYLFLSPTIIFYGNIGRVSGILDAADLEVTGLQQLSGPRSRDDGARLPQLSSSAGLLLLLVSLGGRIGWLSRHLGWHDEMMRGRLVLVN